MFSARTGIQRLFIVEGWVACETFKRFCFCPRIVKDYVNVKVLLSTIRGWYIFDDIRKKNLAAETASVLFLLNGRKEINRNIFRNFFVCIDFFIICDTKVLNIFVYLH